MNLPIGNNGKTCIGPFEVSYRNWKAFNKLGTFINHIGRSNGNLHIYFSRFDEGRFPDALYDTENVTEIYANGCRLQEISPRIAELHELKFLDLSVNPLHRLPELPEPLKDLWINRCEMETLPPLPASLSTLAINNNNIEYLVVLPDTITHMTLQGNPLIRWPEWPASLEILIASNIDAGELPEWEHLPLTEISLIECSLKTLPPLPPTLKKLDVSVNNLTSLPELPQGLEYLHVSQNSLTSLPVLPPELKSIYASINYLTSLPLPPPALELFEVYHNPLPGDVILYAG